MIKFFFGKSLGFFLHEYPNQTIKMILLLFLSGVVESVGAVSLIPLLGSFIGDGGGSNPLMLRISEAFRWFGIAPTFESMLVFLSTAMLIKMVLTMLAFREVGYVEAEVSTSLRMRLLNGLLRAKWSYFISRPTGELINALSTECSQAGVALRMFGNLLSFSIQAIAYLIVGIFVSWHLLFLGLSGGLIFFWIFRKLIHFVRQAGNRQIAALNAMSSTFSDVLTGAKPLKVMHTEEHIVNLIKSQVLIFKSAVRQHAVGVGIMSASQEPLLVIIMALALFLASKHLNIDPTTLLAMAFFFHRILSRFLSAQQSRQQFAALEGTLNSLRGKIDTITANAEPFESGQKIDLAKEVSLENVCFGYDDKNVLNCLSLTVPVGSITALCGPSGVGKSTVSDLITGLSKPGSGDVKVDGVSLSKVDMIHWRDQIGYVPQEVFLFNDTIRNNVALGRASSDDDIWKALTRAGAKTFVDDLADKLDAMVGEHGRALSGGQRQRLMIARALLGEPKILILDESTTGLDEATEKDILTNIVAMKENMAVLAISHQNAVRQIADQTYSL